MESESAGPGSLVSSGFGMTPVWWTTGLLDRDGSSVSPLSEPGSKPWGGELSSGLVGMDWLVSVSSVAGESGAGTCSPDESRSGIPGPGADGITSPSDPRQLKSALHV